MIDLKTLKKQNLENWKKENNQKRQIISMFIFLSIITTFLSFWGFFSDNKHTITPDMMPELRLNLSIANGIDHFLKGWSVFAFFLILSLVISKLLESRKVHLDNEKIKQSEELLKNI